MLKPKTSFRNPTKEDVDYWVKRLELELRPLGFHIGLTGSMLYGMGTGKDIDIIIYSHSKVVDGNYAILEKKLQELGFVLAIDPTDLTHYDRYVVVANNGDIRIDFFLFNN